MGSRRRGNDGFFSFIRLTWQASQEQKQDRVQVARSVDRTRALHNPLPLPLNLAQPRHELDEITGAETAVELVDQYAVPPVFHRAG
jgi:hypothetical protein